MYLYAKKKEAKEITSYLQLGYMYKESRLWERERNIRKTRNFYKILIRLSYGSPIATVHAILCFCIRINSTEAIWQIGTSDCYR